MAQHDYNIANQSGADFRSDLNNALSAIASTNSGDTSPTTTFANQLWIDTANNVLKIRNEGNSAWITTGISITADNTFNIDGGTVNGITALSFSSGSSVTTILDEDNLGSNSATALATQQSIKAYVDSQVGSVDTLAEILTNGNTTGGTDISLSSSDITGTGNINITGTIQSSGAITGNLTGNVTGNASTATALQTARTINGASFDGTANISFNTDSVSEGSSNLYFTNARVESYLDAGSATPTFASAVINSSLTGSAILDDDTFGTASATTVATSESIKAYVDSQVATADSLAEVLANGNTTGGSNILFGDNDKAIFGDGSDLQIYHDGSNSYIRDAGDGDLNLRGDAYVRIQSQTSGTSLAHFRADAEVALYYNNSKKLETTSTGIDVTGTVVADGLTVDTSTLVVDATNNRVGIGTTSPDTALHVNSGTTNTAATFQSTDSTVVIPFIDSVGSTQIRSIDGEFAIRTGGDAGSSSGTLEHFRIDGSGNVGIGETSPSTKLHITSAAPNIRLEDSDTNSYGEIVYNTAGGGLLIRSDENAATGASGSNILFETDSSERVRIDSSGNLLVNKTSAALTGAGTAILSTGTHNVTADGDTTLQLNRLTSDGNLITFYKDTSTVGSIGAYNSATAILSGSAGSYSGLYLNTNKIEPVGNNFGSEIRANDTIDIGSSTYKFKDLHLSGTANAGTIASGQITITQTHPTLFLQTSGGGATDAAFLQKYSNDLYLYNKESAGSLFLGTDNATKATIDSSGNVLVGTSASVGTTPAKLEILGGTGGGRCINTKATVDTSANHITFHNGNGQVGYINTNGTTTAYNTSSDARLKDITGSARGLEVINELNPVSYNWKADGKADEGLIAQEVQEIVPNAVSGSEEEMYQMDYSKLVVHLVKAVKEQQTQIEALQSEINLLKGE